MTSLTRAPSGFRPARRRRSAPSPSPPAVADGFDQRRFLALVTLSGLGLGMTAPITALFAESFGVGATLAGFAVSSVAISLLFMDLFGAELIPRLEARTMFSVALSVFGAGSLVSAAAPSLIFMLGARVLQGFGAALFMGGGLQIAVRHAPDGGLGRAIGSFNAAWFTGIAVGPLLAGTLAEIGTGQTGYRIAFLTCGLTCFAIAIAARLALPALPAIRPRPRLTRPRRARPRAGLRLWPPLALCTFGQALRAGLVFTLIPLYGTNHLGLSTTTVGIAVSALAVVDITTMRVGGALADRVGQRRVLTVALVIGAVTCATAAVVTTALAFTVWTAVLGVTVAVAWIAPTAIIVHATDDREVAVGNSRVASDVGQLSGSVSAGGLVATIGYHGATLAVAGLLLLVAVSCARLRELQHTAGPAEQLSPEPAAP